MYTRTLPQSQLCTFRPFLALLMRPVLVRLTGGDSNDMALGLVENRGAEREVLEGVDLVEEGRRRGAVDIAFWEGSLDDVEALRRL